MLRRFEQATNAFPKLSKLCWTCASIFAVLGGAKPETTLAAPDDVVQAAEAEAQDAPFDLAQPNFEQIVFPGFVSIAAARTQITARKRVDIQQLNDTCDLSAAQSAKLQLAAAGDVKRLFDGVDALRDQFRAAKGDDDALRPLWQVIQAHTGKIDQVLFGDNSMVSKTTRSVLTPDQFARYQAVREERQRSYYAATVEAYLVVLEEVVPMTAAQHDALVKLLVEETPAPLIHSANGFFYVRYQLATFSDQRLARFLDDRQRLLIEQQLSGADGLKQFLIMQGLLPPEEPASGVDSDVTLGQAEQ